MRSAARAHQRPQHLAPDHEHLRRSRVSHAHLRQGANAPRSARRAAAAARGTRRSVRTARRGSCGASAELERAHAAEETHSAASTVPSRNGARYGAGARGGGSGGAESIAVLRGSASARHASAARYMPVPVCSRGVCPGCEGGCGGRGGMPSARRRFWRWAPASERWLEMRSGMQAGMGGACRARGIRWILWSDPGRALPFTGRMAERRMARLPHVRVGGTKVAK